MTPIGFGIGERFFEPSRGVVRAPDGAEAVLRPKTARVLLHLARRGGELVEREELIEAVWPGVYVTDDSLTQCIAEIRRALGSDQALLRTLPRRGYLLDVAPPVMAAGTGAPPTSSANPAGIPVVAMMPLRLPPGTDPDLAAFADILVDGVVGALAAIREPIVISTNSTRHLSFAAEDVPSLARRIGADYLASGDLRRLGGRVRLAIELSEASQGMVVWHRVYDLPLDGVFDAPDELAMTIAHTIMPRLREAELRTALRRRHDLGAYHLMLQGQRQMARLERASFDGAGDMLRRSALLDPGFAAPHVALAEWHSLRIGQRWSDDPVAEARMLEAELRRALELDGGHARALALLGHSYTILYRDCDRAQLLLDRALELTPNDAQTCLWVSPTLAYSGRAEEAVRSAERAIRLSPEDPLLFRYEHFLSIAHYVKGCWEEAAHWGLRSMRSNDGYTSNLMFTAATFAALGRKEEARLLLARVQEIRGGALRVDSVRQRLPYRDEAVRERYLGHLIAAGLPE